MTPSAGTPGDLPTALAVARMLLSFGGDADPEPKPARKRASGARQRRPPKRGRAAARGGAAALGRRGAARGAGDHVQDLPAPAQRYESHGVRPVCRRAREQVGGERGAAGAALGQRIALPRARHPPSSTRPPARPGWCSMSCQDIAKADIAAATDVTDPNPTPTLRRRGHARVGRRCRRAAPRPGRAVTAPPGPPTRQWLGHRRPDCWS